jgi:ubiquinone/menaquinone biosynthesis C-methylase UbiE
MTQFGRVIHERLGPDYQNATCFMAADAESACFADDMFDGVVMFAALHHFPDPVAILRALARKTKAGGFLGVLREPCEPNPWDVAYLRDIRNGINEQMFSIEEYNEIFRRAGVRPESMRVDGGHSLKAILTRY